MMSVSRNSSGLSSPFLKDALAWIFHVSVCPDAAITPMMSNRRERISSTSRSHT